VFVQTNFTGETVTEARVCVCEKVCVCLDDLIGITANTENDKKFSNLHELIARVENLLINLQLNA